MAKYQVRTQGLFRKKSSQFTDAAMPTATVLRCGQSWPDAPCMNNLLPGNVSFPTAARTISILYWAACSACFGYLVFLILRSFTALRSDDISFLYYLAWLMNEHHLAPYRELYDTSFPGTFMLHAAITALFGYSDTGFHAANLTFFIALAAITWQLLSAIHPRVAAAAIAGFGFYYFTSKTSMFLQRDYLALLPAVFALLLAHREWLSVRARMISIGFLFALSASIKPHFAIGLPIVLLLASRQNILACAMLAAAGFLTWIAVCAIWLWHLDALGSFIDMTINYLPLYMSLDEQQNPSSYMERLPWMFDEYFSRMTIVLIIAAIGCIWATIAMKLSRQRALIIALAALTPVYIVYVIIGGRGWDYHWMPFMYFALTCVALLAAPINSPGWRLQLLSLLPLTLLCYGLFYLATRPTMVEPKDTATTELQQWMQTHIQPDDRVQMMVTGTGGPLFASLLDFQLKPVTRYPLGLMFYQYADNPYIQSARSEFMQQLAEHPPRFIFDNNLGVYVSDLKGEPDPFVDYDHFLVAHYKPVYDNRDREPLPEKQLTVYEYQP